jgi:peptidyl-tRNA hydrolase
MGFFKKIGGSLKKATKQISFKNLVKVAGSIDPSGIVSGMQQAHELKKQERAEESAYQAEVVKTKLGAVAGTLAGSYVDAALNGAYNAVDPAYKKVVAEKGADIADLTIKAWFEKHWKKIAIAVGGIIALVIIWKKFLSNPNSSGRGRKR